MSRVAVKTLGEGEGEGETGYVRKDDAGDGGACCLEQLAVLAGVDVGRLPWFITAWTPALARWTPISPPLSFSPLQITT